MPVDVDQAALALRSKGVLADCIRCSQLNSMAVVEPGYVHLVLSPTAVEIALEGKATVGIVRLCTNCGFTELFNAHTLGV